MAPVSMNSKRTLKSDSICESYAQMKKKVFFDSRCINLDALGVLCVQRTRNLFTIAKFLDNGILILFFLFTCLLLFLLYDSV